MDQKIVNGFTLIGVALAVFALRGASIKSFSYWSMALAGAIIFILALVELWSKKKSESKI